MESDAASSLWQKVVNQRKASVDNICDKDKQELSELKLSDVENFIIEGESQY